MLINNNGGNNWSNIGDKKIFSGISGKKGDEEFRVTQTGSEKFVFSGSEGKGDDIFNLGREIKTRFPHPETGFDLEINLPGANILPPEVETTFPPEFGYDYKIEFPYPGGITGGEEIKFPHPDMGIGGKIPLELGKLTEKHRDRMTVHYEKAIIQTGTGAPGAITIELASPILYKGRHVSNSMPTDINRLFKEYGDGGVTGNITVAAQSGAGPLGMIAMSVYE